jgi:photosystem II stability/assembly factor-like uncharacterized protein
LKDYPECKTYYILIKVIKIMKRISLFLLLLIITAPFSFSAKDDKDKKDTTLSGIVGGLKWRSIGPAFTSGRIADFAINPQNHNEYYIAVASGNIWKTTNNGTTFDPVFENYGAYSLACIVIDPNNPFVVWAGTGENNHQRALGYGDGVYKSVDGGKSWKNMGLKDSRQIGGIVIDPRNSNIIFVAAEGSVWGPGGDRGLYKSTDGGKTWKKSLEISENTGVNNIIYDPRNPDVMYATSEQRRRHVFTKIGGGPETSVYKSTDEGETWDKIINGLPKVDMGGIGIAISPVNPDILYLVLEAAENKGGFFRSSNRGAIWEKMNDYTAQGQYFNELYCDPKNVDKVYNVDVLTKVTLDGGKTWKPIGVKNRHVDDHAMWIDPQNSDHFLIGGDGGVYETFDGGNNYSFKNNLPITQFYRITVDNTIPFYYVFGGMQDNNSMGGPSATLSSDGIVNSDWFITNGGDGFWSAVDPENPNIVYAESQYGGMVRYDRASGEMIDIRPEPPKGDSTYKWNWNTPLFVSPHNHNRIYCAAEKVFRSDDRGDTWQLISDDLTAKIDRNSFPVMGKYWSIDAVSKDKSTSLYGEIISLTESPVKENLLYAGTDDGLIQVTENAKDWRKVSDFPEIPEHTYVSDICASKFDENIVFASFDNILRDDFKPYILKSNDKGRSWYSIAGNLPNNGTIHSIQQDYMNPDLLFVGTEFGIFVTTNGGKVWAQMKNGLPTIPIRQIAIQKRENDLVIATFGRGIYILDNYTPLRELNSDLVNKYAYFFPVKDALMYIPTVGRYGQGASYFKATNPEFGAVFTYYLKEVPKTLNQLRKEKEKDLFKEGKPIYQPTDEEIRAEQNEKNPYLIFTIKDEVGNIVRKLTKEASKGISRLSWNLEYYDPSPVTDKDKFSPTSEVHSSTLALPGKYNVSMALATREGFKDLVGPVQFNVVPLKNTTIPVGNRDELVAFQKQAFEILREVKGTESFLKDIIKRVEDIKYAINITPAIPVEMMNKAENISKELELISLKFNRDSNRPSPEENPPSPLTFNERLNILAYTHNRSTSNITRNERNSYSALVSEFPPVLERIKSIYNVDLKNLESELEKFNAPWTPGRIPDIKLK